MGSDGRGHTFLAKPKDDLRKDHRMMEVVGVINRLCAREPASRRRNLYLRRCWPCLLEELDEDFTAENSFYLCRREAGAALPALDEWHQIQDGQSGKLLTALACWKASCFKSHREGCG